MRMEHKSIINSYINDLTFCIIMYGVITEKDFKEITRKYFPTNSSKELVKKGEIDE